MTRYAPGCERVAQGRWIATMREAEKTVWRGKTKHANGDAAMREAMGRLTQEQTALLHRAIDRVAEMDPNEILREHLEAIASGVEVSALTSAEEARKVLAAHPRPIASDTPASAARRAGATPRVPVTHPVPRGPRRRGDHITDPSN